MYKPPKFVENDTARLHALITDYPFATLLTVEKGAPIVSHLPFLVDTSHGELGILRCHMARANPQWQQFAEDEVQVLFQGPHAYVSPTWYASGPALSTWNYAVVHAFGVPRVLDADAALDLVHDMVAEFDAAPADAWPMDDVSRKFRLGMIDHVVAFEIPIARLEGKYKMSQNRPPEDRPRIVAALSASDDPLASATAGLIRTD